MMKNKTYDLILTDNGYELRFKDTKKVHMSCEKPGKMADFINIFDCMEDIAGLEQLPLAEQMVIGFKQEYKITYSTAEMEQNIKRGEEILKSSGLTNSDLIQ